MKISTMLLLLLLLLFAGFTHHLSTADADVLTVVNSSFETPSLGEGSSTSVVSGWTLALSTSIMNPSVTQFPLGATTNGQNAAMISPNGLLTQNLPHTLQYGSYSIQFDIGNRLDSGDPLVGSNFKANGIGVLLDSSFIPTPSDGQFQTAIFNYLVTPTNGNNILVGNPLRIEIFFSSPSSGIAAIDNVQVNFTPIPEPSSCLTLGLMLAGLVLSRRRAC